MNSATLQSYQAPILGVGGSTRFSETEYVVLGTLDDFGSRFAEGVVIGIDLQTEQSQEQILLGSMREKGTGLVITYNAGDKLHKLKIHLQDNLGKRLIQRLNSQREPARDF